MRLRRVLGALLLVALVALAALVLVFSVPGLVGADQSYVVLSGSMEPAIAPGDAVIVNSVPPEQISAGDVITFETNEAVPTTHRVVDVVQTDGGLEFQTKGDAVENADPETVPAAAVVGRVAFTIPYLGLLVNWVNTPVGYLTLIATPLALLVLSEAWTIIREGRDDGATAATAASASAGGSETFRVTAQDLRLSGVVLFAFTAYAGWLAIRAPGSALRVGVAVGTALLTLFLVVLYWQGTRSAAAPPGADVDPPETAPDGGEGGEADA